MITINNLKEVIQSIAPDTLQAELGKTHDWIMIEVSIFNAGWFATVTSMDYSEESMSIAQEHGDLYLDKMSFSDLLEEHEILEY